MSTAIEAATRDSYAPPEDEYNRDMAQPSTIAMPQWVINKMRAEAYKVQGAVETRENEVWPSGSAEPTDEERRTNRVGKTVEIKVNHLDATYLQMCQLYCIYMPLQLRIENFRSQIIDRLPQRPSSFTFQTGSTNPSQETEGEANAKGFYKLCQFNTAMDYKTLKDKLVAQKIAVNKPLAKLHDENNIGEPIANGEWDDEKCAVIFVDRDVARTLRVGMTIMFQRWDVLNGNLPTEYYLGSRIRGIYLDSGVSHSTITGSSDIIQVPKAILVLSTNLGDLDISSTSATDEVYNLDRLHILAPTHFMKCEDLFGPSFLRDISELDPTQPEFDYRYHYSPRMLYRDVVFKSDVYGDSARDKYKLIFGDLSSDPAVYVDIINKNRLTDEGENHMVKAHSPYESNEEMKEGCLHFGLKYPDVGQYNAAVAKGIKEDSETQLESTGGGLVCRIFLPGIRYRRDHTTHFSRMDFRYAENTIMALQPSLTDDRMEKTMINDLEYATVYPTDTLYYAASQQKLGIQKNRHTDWPLTRSVVEESRNMSNYGLNHVRWQIRFPWQQIDSLLEESVPLRAQTQPLSVRFTFLNSFRLVEDRDENGDSYAHRLGVRTVKDGETQYTKNVYNVAESANQLREWINFQCPSIESGLAVSLDGRTVRDIMRWGDEQEQQEGYSQIEGTTDLKSQVPIAYHVLATVRDISLSDTSETKVAVRADIRDVHFETTKTITSNEIERAAIQSHISGRLYTIPRYLFEKFEVVKETKGEHKFQLKVAQTEIVKSFHIAVRRKKPTTWIQRAQVDELTRNVAQERIPYTANYYNRFDAFLDAIEYFDFRSGETSLLDRENRRNRNVKYHMHDRMRRKMGRTTLYQTKGNLRNIISWTLADPLFSRWNADKSSIDFNRLYDPTIVIVFKEGVHQEGLEVCIAYHCTNVCLTHNSNYETVRAQLQ